MRVQVETITPERAKEMLSTMKNNRRIRPTHVDQLARDMENGDFVENNDAICFNEKGELVNGQHRLSAVIKSGATVDMLVAYDFPNVAIIDRPSTRDTADTLKMRGKVGEKLSSSNCISLVNAYISVKYTDWKRWSDIQKENFIIENSYFLSLALEIVRRNSQKPLLRKAGPSAAVFAALKKGAPEEKIARFAECTNSGFYSGEAESASSVLRTQLLLTNTSTNRGDMGRRDQISWTEQAIRDFTLGRSRRKPYKRLDYIYI